jgi:hypothetical protein
MNIQTAARQSGTSGAGRETWRYTWIGAAFGVTFPIVATFLRALLSGMPLNLSTFVQVQLSDPILWIVDTAPFVLGAFARIGGIRQDRLQELNARLGIREQDLEAAAEPGCGHGQDL